MSGPPRKFSMIYCQSARINSVPHQRRKRKKEDSYRVMRRQDFTNKAKRFCSLCRETKLIAIGRPGNSSTSLRVRVQSSGALALFRDKYEHQEYLVGSTKSTTILGIVLIRVPFKGALS